MNKTSAIILIIVILLQIFFPIIPKEVFAIGEEEESTEITRNYEIPETKEWDFSANGDGSVKGVWTRSNRTLVISGTGSMKDWTYDEVEERSSIDSAIYENLIEKVIIEDGITTIGDYAFKYCYSLTQIEIPEGVTSIGDSAFSRCSCLTQIEIPESVTSIGSWAFYPCESLTEIDVDINNKNYTSEGGVLFNKDKTKIIKYPEGKLDNNYQVPGGVTSIGKGAFDNCRSLLQIEIPGSVTRIEDYAFANCSSLTQIEIPSSVTSIENYAFYYCESLTQIKILGNVRSIAYYAFNKCTSLTHIEIPESVTSIETMAFYDCDSLTQIEIPSSVTSIESFAFENCDSLTQIDIPGSVTNIEISAFDDCNRLRQIDVDVNNNNYASEGGVLFNKDKTQIIEYPEGKEGANYQIPEGVTSIGNGAFEDCRSLTQIEIPRTVTSIGVSAFYGCRSLTQIEIPEGVTSIGRYAFGWCSSLKQLTIPDSVTSIGDYAISENTIINVNFNSYAHSWAEENAYAYIIISGDNGIEGEEVQTNHAIPETKKWDFSANGDGSVKGVWTRSNRTLVISGTGNMKDWTDDEVIYYRSIIDSAIYKRLIEKVIIEEGITSIGAFAFYDCDSLTQIEIPSSVTSVTV